MSSRNKAHTLSANVVALANNYLPKIYFANINSTFVDSRATFDITLYSKLRCINENIFWTIHWARCSLKLYHVSSKISLILIDILNWNLA
jgi:hypothetical protein